MVSYTTGSCSAEEKDEFETHLLSCHECVAILAIVLREKASAQLHQSGVEAARIARTEEKRKSRRPSRANRVTAQRAAAR